MEESEMKNALAAYKAYCDSRDDLTEVHKSALLSTMSDMSDEEACAKSTSDWDKALGLKPFTKSLDTVEVFDTEALEKALEEIEPVAAEAAQVDLEPAESAFDAQPEIILAKSLDAGDFVGGVVDATCTAINRAGDAAVEAANNTGALAKAVLATGRLTKSLVDHASARDARLELVEDLVKGIAERLQVPALRKGATNEQELQALGKPQPNAGEDGKPGQTVPGLRKSLISIRDGATDDGLRRRAMDAMADLTAGDARPALRLVETHAAG